MAIIKWTPFDSWEDMEQLWRNFQLPAEKSFVPAMDVYKEKDSLVVKTPIVDFDPKNIDIEIKGNVLTVKGKTEKKSEVEEKNYYRKEIKSGSFSRSVLLPAEVQEDKSKAEYLDGILKITVPLAKIAKTKTVKVAVKKSKGEKVSLQKKK
ncbi:MAG TPA: Hsp20/alpha crystallin family protein [Candidatus Uhrbacteria bacterium]|nr:Hsp20/alpha crystallin family protein [Candidatus Uhrbacteria bacterium]